MIVLSEYSPGLGRTRSVQHLQAATEAARLNGFGVYYIPQDLSHCGDAEAALAHIPSQPSETLAIWIGYIPAPAHYRRVYEAARAKNIVLLNSPEEHLRAQEFDQAYERLCDLTPDSVIVSSPLDCDAAVQELGFPVFVKGIVQSLKGEGWSSCVALTIDELKGIVGRLLKQDDRTRGRVAIRKFVQLRHSKISGLGIPVGREFRVFLYRQKVLGLDYYWQEVDYLEYLTVKEEAAVSRLAHEAAALLGTPFVAIDIGQLEDGTWTVIEPGDGQFAGYCKIPILELWKQIASIGN